MARAFMGEDFLLGNAWAQALYVRYAKDAPIFDYHCHLPPQDVAADRCFENLTQAWLEGDHYKWRAMRSNGVSERFCTGNATDQEKFAAWAQTVPYCLRNPLYHWTHLELRRYFGVTQRLSSETADSTYAECAEKLQSPEFSTRNLMRKMKVKAVCTTDDPADDLSAHRKIREDGFEIKVLPTYRPDRCLGVEDPVAWNTYMDRLGAAADMTLASYDDLMAALDARHAVFHEAGCRLSDHGLDTAYAEEVTVSGLQRIFSELRAGRAVTAADAMIWKSGLMLEFGRMDFRRGWVQQLHFGAMRNNNTGIFKALGPDKGCDSIGDLPVAYALSRFLDRLDQTRELPKTILYNLNPRDNAVMTTMIGNFQDGLIPGKMQFGSGWWFLDQKDGMTDQINALSSMGLLSRFVGMLTDSRSFLSYPRHEYFRRILCNLLGQDIERGELPDDLEEVGRMVSNICYHNAHEYFGIPLD